MQLLGSELTGEHSARTELGSTLAIELAAHDFGVSGIGKIESCWVRAALESGGYGLRCSGILAILWRWMG